MIKNLFIAATFAGIAACSSPEDMADDVGVETPDTPALEAGIPPKPPKPPETLQAAGVNYVNNEEQNGGEREFSYAWPAEVSAIPSLVAELTQERDAALAQQKQWWAESIADCPPEFASCRNSSYELEWQVVADLPGYLSLSNGFYAYTGGAHGNYGRGSRIWDRKADASVRPKDMFASLDALDGAISEKACTMLNAQRKQRRGEEVFRGEGEWPNQCVSMEETVLFLGSSGGEKFDRIGIYYAPYIAGAYAEGDYEFTLPVTQTVIDALKPGYKNAFAMGE